MPCVPVYQKHFCAQYRTYDERMTVEHTLACTHNFQQFNAASVLPICPSKWPTCPTSQTYSGKQ